jgi:hypothetical protein
MPLHGIGCKACCVERKNTRRWYYLLVEDRSLRVKVMHGHSVEG